MKRNLGFRKRKESGNSWKLQHHRNHVKGSSQVERAIEMDVGFLLCLFRCTVKNQGYTIFRSCISQPPD